MAGNPKQLWLGNIPVEMTEVEVINYIGGLDFGTPWYPPYKVVLRESSGNNLGFLYGFATFLRQEDAATLKASGGLLWPNGRDCLVRYPF